MKNVVLSLARYNASGSHDDLTPFPAALAVVDHHDPAVREFSEEVRRGTEIETVRTAYEAVRDRLPHSYDIGAPEVSVSASDVLRHGHGICFAKAHLLAAVLRTCNIPAGFSYQRLLLDDANPGRTCLHGFNAVWLSKLGRWVRLDARGNKSGIRAEFDLSCERLAYAVRPEFGECDYPEINAEPAACVIQYLARSRSIAELNADLLPDLIRGGGQGKRKPARRQGQTAGN
jgi:transglutaminase superfamily protein